MDNVEVFVIEPNGERTKHEFPTDMSLSLMEGLKGSGYPIQATCGGMALCATCHIQVVEGLDNLNEPEDDELDMLDTLPDAGDDSRLSCQLRIADNLNGMVLRILGNPDGEE